MIFFAVFGAGLLIIAAPLLVGYLQSTDDPVLYEVALQEFSKRRLLVRPNGKQGIEHNERAISEIEVWAKTQDAPTRKAYLGWAAYARRKVEAERVELRRRDWIATIPESAPRPPAP
jgi:hypothetical protein